jgi:hypothetical protein
MPTTNFTKGVTNITAQNILGQMIQLDPTQMHTFFNDFDEYHAGNWTVTETQAGATQALTNVDGGVLLLTNSAADDDLIALQKVGESFKFEAGKKLFFKARLAVSDATQSDFVVGLQITDTTPLAVTDGVYFRKDDGDANLDFVVIKDSTASTASAIATVVAATYITVGFYYNGVDEVVYAASTNSLNPTVLGKLATTNLPNDEELTVSFAIQNGEAVSKTMSVDYIFVAKER